MQYMLQAKGVKPKKIAELFSLAYKLEILSCRDSQRSVYFSIYIQDSTSFSGTLFFPSLETLAWSGREGEGKKRDPGNEAMWDSNR